MKEKFDPIDKKVFRDGASFEELSASEKSKEIASAEARAWLENTPTLKKKAEVVKSEQEQKDLFLVADIAETIKAADGYALIVGGYARDEALKKFGYNLEYKDIDLEVFGLQPEKLQELLLHFGKLNLVGSNFAVVKLKLETGSVIDVSLPRKDSKVALGHKGFEVEYNPEMTLIEASKRRDFTINSLFLDPLTGEIIDKHGGLIDMQNKILRATDDKAFAEDPLRVLRGAQFAARFGFTIEPHTIKLCRLLDLAHAEQVVPERVGEEWAKLLGKSPKPSIGLEAMRELGVIEKLHPELQALIGVPQSQKWHPEGDVWEHTKQVVDAAARIVRRNNVPEDKALVIMLASLCHDLGKPETTVVAEDGKITSHKHEVKGVSQAESFLKSLKTPNAVIERILPLVREHLFPPKNPNPSESSVRQLAKRLHPATIRELVMVSEADIGGRDKLIESFPEGEAL